MAARALFISVSPIIAASAINSAKLAREQSSTDLVGCYIRVRPITGLVVVEDSEASIGVATAIAGDIS